MPLYIYFLWRSFLTQYDHGLKIYFTQLCSRCLIVKTMEYRIVVSEFVFLLHYYVHFPINTLGKGMSPFIQLWVK